MVKHTFDTIDYFVSRGDPATKQHVEKLITELSDISLLSVLEYMHSDAYALFWSSTHDDRDIRWAWAFRKVKFAVLGRGEELLAEAQEFLTERCFSDLLGKW